MSLSLAPIRLSESRTAEGMMAEARALIPQMTPYWTYLGDADPDIAALRVLFRFLEWRSLELDMRAAETTLPFVQQRPNAVRLLRLIGYRFARSRAARTTLRFTLSSAQSRPVPLYAYWDPRAIVATIRASADVPFVLPAFATIPAGALYKDVDVIQGRPAKYGPHVLGATTSRVVTLPDKDIAEGTILVAWNGQFWKVVYDWVESGPESLHALEETDENGVVTLTFGDGNTGAVPSGTLEVLYVRTLGAAGSGIGAGRSVSLSAVIADADGVPILPRVSVTSLTQVDGGEDEESVAHAKKQASLAWKAQKRAVTKPDLRAWVEGYPGVLQASAVDINDLGPESDLIDYYQIKVPVVPTTGTLPSAALKRGLQAFIDEIKDFSADVEVTDPVYVPVSISVDIYVKRGFTPQDVEAAVQTAIVTFMSAAESPAAELALTGEAPPGMMFGVSLRPELLGIAVQAVEGVAFVSTLSPEEEVSVDALSIAVLSGTPVVNVLGTV